MTRTGVLSLLVAACAVTNSNLAYAGPSVSNPRQLQSSRSMQAFLSSSITDYHLDELQSYHEQVFSQFIDSTITTRLEGHLTTDKIFYMPGDAVFIDLLVLNTLDKTPYYNTVLASSLNVTVSLLDNTGEVVSGVTSVTTPLYQGPAHGFTFALPLTISAGNYLIVAEHMYMATATRTIVVQIPPSTAPPAASTDPYTATWKVFVPNITTSTTKIGGSVTITKASGSALKATLVQFVVTFSDGTSLTPTPVVTTTGPTGIAYFYFTSALTATAESYYQISFTTVVPLSPPLNVQKTINIGDLYQQIQLIDGYVPTPMVDYTRLNVYFFSESMSDLVPDVPNVIYFRAYLKATPTLNQEPFNFMNATLFAYDPQLPAVPIEVIQTDVSSVQGGFGVLNEIVYNSSKVYYLEFNPGHYMPMYGEYEFLYNEIYPTEESVTLMDGTMRFPIIVEGIQTQLSNIELQLFDNEPFGPDADFPYHLLYDYSYEVTASFNDPTSGSSNELTLGYLNGYFYVKVDFFQQPDVTLPPVLVFNNFPLPSDFSNLLLSNTNNHQKGLATLSSQTNAKQVYQSNGNNYFSFNSLAISELFYKHLAGDLEATFPNQFQKLHIATRADFTTATPIMTDAVKITNIMTLRNAFLQVPLVPKPESTYFGKYGAIDEQVAQEFVPLSTITLDYSQITPPTIVMSIPQKNLSNTDELIVEISTNIDHDTDQLYLLQIQYKEMILYQDVLDIQRRMEKEKFVFDSSNFDLPNGGILQVNLQRITQDFDDFLSALEARTACDLTTITSAYKSMVQTDKNAINAIAEYDVSDYEILSTLLDELQITIPGTTCLLIGPDLVSRFLEPVGQISIFKEPAYVYHAAVSGSCPDSICHQNQAQTINIQLQNAADGSNVIVDPASFHKATVIVTKDIGLGNNTFYDSTFTGKVYLENDVDFQKFSELDPLSQTDGIFSTYDDALNLDILLVANNLRNSVFQSKLYQILGHDQDFFNYFSNALPKTWEQLSQQFGYNFEMNTWNQDPLFAETDIRNYINPSNIEDNIVNLVGANMPFHANTPSINLYSALTSAVLNSPWTWSTIPALTYSSFAAPYQAETQYFANNVNLDATGHAQFNYNLADTAGDYYVEVYTYSEKGYSYGYYTYTVLPSIDIQFDIPDQITYNDNANITVTIYNGEQYYLKIVPSYDDESESSDVDFTYTKWNLNTATGTYSYVNGQTNYALTAAEQTQVQSFQLTGLIAGSGPNPVTFTFMVTYSTSPTFSSSKTYTLTVTQQVNVVKLYTYTNFYASGQLSTNMYETYAYTSDEVTLYVPLPGMDQSSELQQKIFLYPQDASYIFKNVQRTIRDNSLDATLADLIARISIATAIAFPLPVTNLNSNSAEFLALYQQANQFILAGLQSTETFQIRDMFGNAAGLDMFRESGQEQGDLVVTANLLSVLLNNYEVVYQDQTQYTYFNQLVLGNLAWMDTMVDSTCDVTLNSVYTDTQTAKAFLVFHISFIQYKISQINQFKASPSVAKLLAFIQSCVSSTNANGIYLPNQALVTADATAPLSTNPYRLGYVITALYSTAYYQYSLELGLAASFASVNSLADGLCAQLNRHIMFNGEIVFPESPELSRDYSSIYGGVGIDLLAETGAKILDAFTWNDAIHTQYNSQLMAVKYYLKTLNFNTQFGGIYSSAQVLTQFGIFEENFLAASYNVRIEIDGEPFFHSDLNIPAGSYLPIELNIPTSAYNPDNFGTDTPSMITIDITKYQTPIVQAGKQVDALLGWSFAFFGVSGSLYDNSSPVYEHDLAFTVSSLQDPNMLGDPAYNGETFMYQVTIVNQNAVRSTGPIQVYLRPPSCLQIDVLQFNDLIDQGIIGNSLPSESTHEYNVFPKGIMPMQQLTFSYYGTQVWSGDCQVRPHQLYLEFTQIITVVAVPDEN